VCDSYVASLIYCRNEIPITVPIRFDAIAFGDGLGALDPVVADDIM